MTRTRLVIFAALLSAGCSRTIMTSPTPTADADAILREFTGVLAPGTSASRDFDVAAAGQVTVVLKSTTPPGITIGLGVGIPRSNGSCALSAAIEGEAAAHLTIAAEKGAYCTRVYDPGTLTSPVPFTISISRP